MAFFQQDSNKLILLGIRALNLINSLALYHLIQFILQEDRLYLSSKCLQAQLRQCSKLSQRTAVYTLSKGIKTGSHYLKLQL